EALDAIGRSRSYGGPSICITIMAVSPRRPAGPTLEGAREVGGVGVAQFETDVDEPRVRGAPHFPRHLKSDLVDQIGETEAGQGKSALEAAQRESAGMGERGCAGVAARQE